jgi:hypothetical protein
VPSKIASMKPPKGCDTFLEALHASLAHNATNRRLSQTSISDVGAARILKSQNPPQSPFNKGGGCGLASYKRLDCQL